MGILATRAQFRAVFPYCFRCPYGKKSRRTAGCIASISSRVFSNSEYHAVWDGKAKGGPRFAAFLYRGAIQGNRWAT